jgi:hypothetical protein
VIYGAKYDGLANESAKTFVSHRTMGAIKSCHYSDDLVEVKAFSGNDEITNFYSVNETNPACNYDPLTIGLVALSLWI